MRRALIKLKNILMFSLLSLLLVGCTSELDRCIEANSTAGFIPINEITEHSLKAKKLIDDIELPCRDRDAYPDSYLLNYLVWEKDLDSCLAKGYKFYGQAINKHIREHAKAVCHSQGIY